MEGKPASDGKGTMRVLRVDDGEIGFSARPVATAGTATSPGSPLRPHAGLARDVLAAVLVRHGVDGVVADARAERVGGGVHVLLLTDRPVARAVVSVAAVRTIAAVRSVDHDAPHINVSWRCTDDFD
jgi:hypothetical protein